MHEAIRIQQSKEIDGIQNAVRSVCHTLGLSSQHCNILIRSTIKAVGEEFAWRHDQNNGMTVNDALSMLDTWGSTVWLFGDSHIRKFLDTLLRLLGADAVTRRGIGHHKDCTDTCWCPSVFVIHKDQNGAVEKMEWQEQGQEQQDNTITLVFHYFIVRSRSMTPDFYANSMLTNVSKFGSYDRPCVFEESSRTIQERIALWQATQPPMHALLDPDVVVFNAGNWEANENWTVEEFGREVVERAKALKTASASAKLLFVGPPFYNDAVSSECADKVGMKTSQKVVDFNAAARESLQLHTSVEYLDVLAVTKEGAAEQREFWTSLKWTGGRFEMCANHQIPSMYQVFWQLLTVKIEGMDEGGAAVDGKGRDGL